MEKLESLATPWGDENAKSDSNLVRLLAKKDVLEKAAPETQQISQNNIAVYQNVAANIENVFHSRLAKVQRDMTLQNQDMTHTPMQ